MRPWVYIRRLLRLSGGVKASSRAGLASMTRRARSSPPAARSRGRTWRQVVEPRQAAVRPPGAAPGDVATQQQPLGTPAAGHGQQAVQQHRVRPVLGPRPTVVAQAPVAASSRCRPGSGLRSARARATRFGSRPAPVSASRTSNAAVPSSRWHTTAAPGPGRHGGGAERAPLARRDAPVAGAGLDDPGGRARPGLISRERVGQGGLVHGQPRVTGVVLVAVHARRQRRRAARCARPRPPVRPGRARAPAG